MNAATSEPRKFSPSPSPTTSGELRRAADHDASGPRRRPRRSVKAPSSRPAHAASPRSGRRSSTTRLASRWAATSVSVSDENCTPDASSSARRRAKFSMIPLWIEGELGRRPPRCGCALSSVGPPWVAQRVCPMPVVDGGSGCVGERLLEVGRACRPACAWRSRPSVDQGDAGGVVAAVLEPAQALDDHVDAPASVADVAHDAAHGRESNGRRSGGDPGTPRAGRGHRR